MQPSQSSNFFHGHSATSYLPDQSWTSQISVASKAELKMLLNTKCMTMNQLKEIQNRLDIRWTVPEDALIEYRICVLTKKNLEQEIELCPFPSLESGQHTYMNAEENIRSVSTQSSAVSTIRVAGTRPEESAVQVFNGQGGILTRASLETDLGAAGIERIASVRRIRDVVSILPAQALELIANICDKSYDTIWDEINHNNRSVIWDLLDYQPMHLDHLKYILQRAEYFEINEDRKQTLEKRIDRVEAGFIETSTPALRFIYHNMSGADTDTRVIRFHAFLTHYRDHIKDNHHSNYYPNYNSSSHVNVNFNMESYIFNDEDIPQAVLDDSRRESEAMEILRSATERQTEMELQDVINLSVLEFNQEETSKAADIKNEEACQTVLDTSTSCKEFDIQESSENSADRNYSYQSGTAELERIPEKAEEDEKCIVCSNESSVLYVHSERECRGGSFIHCEEHALKKNEPCPVCGDKIQFLMRKWRFT